MAFNFVQTALDKLKKTAVSLGKNVTGYFDPTSNQGNNFWSSTTGKGLANLQKTGLQDINPQKYGEFLRTSTDYYQSKLPESVSKYTKPITNMAANTAQTVGTGVYNIFKGSGQATRGVIENKPITALKGLANVAVGTGQTIVPASPLFQIPNISTNLPVNKTTDIPQRFAQGFLNTISQAGLPETIESKNVKLKLPILGEVEFDPAKSVGGMFGYVKNPTNEQLYKITSSVFNDSKITNLIGKGSMILTKGGIEGFVQGLSSLPDNATEDEIVKHLTNQIIQGAASELFFRSAGAIAKKIWSGFKPYLGGIEEHWNTPIATMEYDAQGNRITVPMWKYKLRSFGLNVEDINKLSEDDYNAYQKQTQKYISENVTTAKSDIQGRKVADQGEIGASKIRTTISESNKPLKTSASETIIPKNATREQVAATIPDRINNFIENTLGYSTKEPEGGTREAGAYTKTLRKGQAILTTKVEEGLGSQNALVRNAASIIQNFFRGAGMSPERAEASMSLRGEMSSANTRSFDVMNSLYDLVGNDKKSLARINAVLDPELATTKISFKDLDNSEQAVYTLIREGLDLVHDTSYANGHISQDLYVKNQGKYTPRLYEVNEVPAEVSKFVTQGKKMVNDLYKPRTDINEWKIENSLNDPVYSFGKRLAQVETNSAIKKYTDFLSSNPRFVSDIERPGFTKLSDSPAYGSLSGKYVLNSAAEDLKGFFFSNQAAQNLYDVFRAYDRMPIRQLQKKLLTVFNPTTNVGNIVSDQVFGFMTGVDPLTLNKNLLDFKNDPQSYKEINDYLISKGINATDITRTDFVNKLGEIDALAGGKKPSKVKLTANKIQSFYGGTDDIYKASAFKALLDKGFTLEEATRKVADGFQNYANVGKYYDVASKTPLIGKPFIKFQGDLIRMIKNAVVNNPIGLITFLGMLKGVSYLSSKISGETDEDRKTRETRFAAPTIPGLNIPLTWQTPWGEINVARYISPFYANNETTNIASNMIPFVPNIDTKKDVASNIALNLNDPLLAPLGQLAVNRDFRGKPISDPNENKYQPSTLTPGEQLINKAKFLGRAYAPPPVNSAIDVASVASGGKDMYGRTQTVPQAVARLGGIKVTQFGSKEAEEYRQKDTEYEQYANEAIDKQINSVYKQQLKGEITEEQATKRVKYLETQKKDVNLTGGTEGIVRYLDEKGTMREVDLSPISEPKYTGNKTMDKKILSDYKSAIRSQQNGAYELYKAGKLSLEEAVKIMEDLQKTYDSLSTGKGKFTVKKVSYSPKAINIKSMGDLLSSSKSVKLKTKKYKFKRTL